MSKSRVHTSNNSAELEHKFLHSKAMTSLFLASSIFFGSIYERSLITEFPESVDWIIIGLMLVSYFCLLILLVKDFILANRMSYKALWSGAFDDEYLEHINRKGYKYGYVTSVSLLAVFYIFDSEISLASWISFRELLPLILFTAMGSYGAAIICHMHGAIDE
jgi:hypothetical protein